MEKIDLTLAFDTTCECVTENVCDASASLLIATLDLPIAALPSVAIWSYSATPDKNLAGRVSAWATQPIDVYVADIKEPMVSGNPFSEKKVLICQPTAGDLDLKQALFTYDSREPMIRKVMHISAILIAGFIATLGSAPLLATLFYAPLHWLASAYTHDTDFLEAFPAEAEALIKKRQTETCPPSLEPKSLGEHTANMVFYATEYLPALLRHDVVANHLETIPTMQEPQKKKEPEVIKEVVEQQPKQLTEETPTPWYDPSKRGGNQGR